jgi:S-adenosyl-L-methionine hydrolase (adenosine-forming)
MRIITLTTDIGSGDFITGAIKGQLLSLQATISVADITHQLSPHNYPQAAYICSSAFRFYPVNTLHIILINLFDAPLKHMLVAKHNNQYIICPDNGMLTMITGQKPAHVKAIPVNNTNTLQCTQSLANAIAQVIDTGSYDKLGNDIDEIEEKYPLRSTIGPNWIEGQIIFIDTFENVVINITRDEFEEQRKGRGFNIQFTRKETIESIKSNYASVPPGEKMAWFNSAGYLEIAINKGNMAGLFGLQRFNDGAQGGSFMQNRLFYQTVRIYFED